MAAGCETVGTKTRRLGKVVMALRKGWRGAVKAGKRRYEVERWLTGLRRRLTIRVRPDNKG